MNYVSPLNWTGFEALGFLDPPAKFIPTILSHSASRNQAFEHFFHRVYRQQCFPHPSTGSLYRQLYRTKNQVIAKNKGQKKSIYPYEWKATCPSEKIITTPKPSIVKPELPDPIILEEKPKIGLAALESPLDTNIVKAIPIVDAEVEKPMPPKINTVATPKPELQVVTLPPSTKDKIKSELETDTIPIKIESPTQSFDNAPLPSVEQPIIIIATPSSTFNSSPISSVISENPENTHGFTGNIYIKQSLSGSNPAIGGSTSWKPIADSFWFFRGAIDYDYKIDDPLTYSWGFGYDDWHEGTWSAQINNWGPITPREGIAWDKAIANIGYKFKSETLANYKLHANTSFDIPTDGEAALNLGIQWNPKENWYVRTNIHQPINGDSATWSYGFGYSNWRPNTFNIEYSNYGDNSLFNTNTRKSGVVSVSYNWEF